MPENPKPPCLLFEKFCLLLRNCGEICQHHQASARRDIPAGQSSQRLGPKDPHRRGVHSLSISPDAIASWIAFGLLPSTWQPTLNAVPRISFTTPSRDLEKLLKRMVRAISIISSSGTDLLCLMFFSFFRSRGGSLRARMIREEAVGTTETVA